jgi:hypothetical protein
MKESMHAQDARLAAAEAKDASGEADQHDQLVAREARREKEEKVMFRGAAILAIGFVLGYSKALQDSEEIKTKLDELTKLIKEKWDESATTPSDDPTETDDVITVDEAAINAVDNSDAT